MAGILDLLFGQQAQQQGDPNAIPLEEIAVQGQAPAPNGAAVLAGMAPHGAPAPQPIPQQQPAITPVGLRRDGGAPDRLSLMGRGSSSPASALPALTKAGTAMGGGGGGGGGGFLGGLGGLLEGLQPMFTGLAMGRNPQESLAYGGYMMAQNRSQKAALNQTANWLTTQGLGPQEAMFLAGNKEALNAWYKEWKSGQKPAWEFQSIFDDQGREQKVMFDKNSGRYNVIGGSKSAVMSPEEEAQKIRIGQATRSQTNVNVDAGQKSETEFGKAMGKSMGETFGAMYQEGTQAGQDLAHIDRLEGLLKKSGSGAGAALKGYAAKNLGIQIGEGASEAEAAGSIIDYLTPRQRVPGSGASSDRDIAIFKSALPGLTRTPEGNRIIIETMRGLAQHKRAQGDIAARVMAGQIDQSQALSEMKALPDPFLAMKASKAMGAESRSPFPTDASSLPKPSSKADFDRLPSGQQFVAPDGSVRVKP